MSAKVLDLVSHKMRKLALSGLPQEELALSMKALLEMERLGKIAQDAKPEPRRLNVV